MEEEIKVSELPEALSVNSDDLLMIVQGGINKKTTASKLKRIDTGTVTIPSGTTITNGYEVTLPLYYQVGNNSLEVRLNSEVLLLATSTVNGHYKEVGNTGALSNKIQFYKTSSDGSWTLTKDILITAVVKGVEQS